MQNIHNKPFESDIYAIVVKTEEGDYMLNSTINCIIKEKEYDNIEWSGKLIIDLYKNDNNFKTIYDWAINDINQVGFSEYIIDPDSLNGNSYKLHFYYSSMYNEENPIYYKITYYDQDGTLQVLE